MLQLNVSPAVKKVADGRPAARQEDNDAAHRARKSREFAKSQFDHCISWPAQSPGLSPLDYSINSHLKAEVVKMTSDPAKPGDIRAAVTTVTEELPEEFIAKAINSSPARLRARLAQKGGISERTLPAYRKEDKSEGASSGAN